MAPRAPAATGTWVAAVALCACLSLAAPQSAAALHNVAQPRARVASKRVATRGNPRAAPPARRLSRPARKRSGTAVRFRGTAGKAGQAAAHRGPSMVPRARLRTGGGRGPTKTRHSSCVPPGPQPWYHPGSKFWRGAIAKAGAWHTKHRTPFAGVYSEDEQFHFLHIAKCAGASFIKQLQAMLGPVVGGALTRCWPTPCIGPAPVPRRACRCARVCVVPEVRLLRVQTATPARLRERERRETLGPTQPHLASPPRTYTHRRTDAQTHRRTRTHAGTHAST